MEKIILPVFYLPPVSWFAEFLNENDDIVFEKFEHFPKQTYRNRANIYGANGKLSLIVPILHDGVRAVKDIQISYAENWQKLHWKSIKTAYQSSPYFEYYEDKLEQIYENEERSLFNFNLKGLEVIQQILKTERKFSFTEDYQEKPEGTDLRNAFSAKDHSEKGFEEYYQTFSDKLGFIEDLSIIDLICNKGPESMTYIKNMKK